MKKIQFSYLLVAFMFTTTFFACNKSEVKSKDFPEIENQKRNEATWIPEEKAKKGFMAWIKIYIGHTAEQCGGTCVKIFWEYMHLNCRGFGNICEQLKKVYIEESDIPGEYLLTFEERDALCEELEFQFPDRSLYITNPLRNNELWMNIPEQIAVRSDVNEPFTLYNVWFSEEQELENP